jgi:hypothetical protein
MNLTRANKTNSVRAYYDQLDSEYWKSIERIAHDNGLCLQQVLQHYLAFIRRRDLPRLLAHYEIFKEVVNIPGSIIELGVFTGCGLFTWANLLETFCPGDRIRKVIGFDDFEGYHEFAKQDEAAKEFVAEHSHSLKGSAALIDALLQLHTNDNLVRGVERALVVKGNISSTVPEFVKGSPGLRISLLYLDANLYEPTKIALDLLFPLVVPGGIVAFNAYGQHPWEGETRALDEFFAKNKYCFTLKRFPFSTIPSGYFKKDIQR